MKEILNLIWLPEYYCHYSTPVSVFTNVTLEVFAGFSLKAYRNLGGKTQRLRWGISPLKAMVSCIYSSYLKHQSLFLCMYLPSGSAYGSKPRSMFTD